MLAHQVPFDPAAPGQALAALPGHAGVFALCSADPRAEPYLSRTPDLRRRIARLLGPHPAQSRRLELAQRIARIEYTPTGSEFESLLLLYTASRAIFGARATRRLHLHAPALLRMSAENAYPRVYVTNRITLSALASLYGPFPSRAAAEKFLDEMLNLFLLRRCHEELHPDPAFPGCLYSEMKMCLAPCFKGCTGERYATEAGRVRAFLDTRGRSLLEAVAAERDAASAELEFERAAQAHARIERIEAVAALASAAMRPLAQLCGLIVQPASGPDQVALFLLDRGSLTGPSFYSVAGMRHPNEQSGSSSLFAHPIAQAPVPLEAPVETASRDVLEERFETALGELRRALPAKVPPQQLSDYLCLFSRWFHRPAAKRTGEILFTGADGALSPRSALRAISRVHQAPTLPR